MSTKKILNNIPMAKIYSDKDYFDEMFRTIQRDLTSIKDTIDGNGKPGLLERISTLEWRVKIILGALPLLSTLYIKESRDAIFKFLAGFIV